MQFKNHKDKRFACACGQMLVLSIFLLLIVSNAFAADLDVSELIGGLKKAIVEAQKTATKPLIGMPWIEGEISYTVKKEVGGGFKLYVVTADGKYAKESVQRVKFRLEPVNGKHWRVEAPGELQDFVVSGVDLTNGKVFVSTKDQSQLETFPIYIKPETKIIDSRGETRKLSDIREGMRGTVTYAPGLKGEPTAATIILGPSSKDKE